MDQWQLKIKFWDQVFPSLPYAFRRSQQFINKYGYNPKNVRETKIVVKSMQIYSRTEEILKKESRAYSKELGTL